MAGDYTRMTFRPRRDYAGVLMQQGRVTLDADWNELVELVDRRFRAELVDTIGRCVYSRETPDAFLIGLAGGALTIGRGRAYVHGLLAENHGSDPQEYDPVLGELRGTQPVPYEQQPYLPDAADVAPLPTSGTYVAYLDVWEREVTYLEDPDLVEKAIAVDTAARLQTAWQVKLLEAPDGTTCDGRVEGWDALIAPSAGRLTTSAVGVPTPTDPCTIAPAGGYRGTENRLYRIEIHDPGPLGTATFKWSSDNAAIAGHVDMIDAARSELTLVRLGRDGVARIGVGDWVETTDDWLELNGLPGELRKVVAVDEVKQSITLEAPLSAGRFDATDPVRHTRVIRWSQKGPTVDAAGGVIAVPAGGPGSPIVLEDGVQIAFDADPAGGEFHVGDYWVCAARTADASVERLDAEPPRGIKHHFCRLAVVSFPDGVTDCRVPPAAPEDHGCDCTVCVTPESHANGTLTIQQAVDLVKATGGKICLQAGFYRLAEPVRIVGARSLALQGKGWRTVLVGPGRLPAIVVEASLGVSLDSFAVVTSPLETRALPTGIAIALRNTVGTAIERCVLLQVALLGREAGPSLTDAVSTAGTASLATALGARGAGAPLIALDGLVLELLVRENVLAGTLGLAPLWADLRRAVDERRALDAALHRTTVTAAADLERTGRGYLLSSDLVVEENLFLCALGGVALEGFSLQLGETRIARNSFLGCVRAGVTSLGITGPAGQVDVAGNLLRVAGTGIAVGTDDTRVGGNGVYGLRPTKEPAGLESVFAGLSAGALRSAAGIVLAPSVRPAPIERCHVLANRVLEVGGDGIAVRTLIASASISENLVERVGGGGIVMDEAAVGELVTVEGNRVLDVGLLADRAVAAGILLARTQNASVSGNTVRGVGRLDVGGRERVGIGLAGCDTARIGGNDVSEIGPEEFVGFGAGIALLAGFREATVADNVVRRADAPAKAPQSTWYALLVEDRLRRPSVLSGAAVPVREELLLFSRFVPRTVSLPRGRGSLGVHGNVLDAFGSAPAALVETDGTCLFNDNRCFLAGAREPVARIEAAALVASSNYLEGPAGVTALDVAVPAGAGFTAVGNLASGPIALNGATPLPAPWAQLNVP